MQPQEHSLIIKRLHRFERRARWHWVERVITLGLVARLLLSGPAGTLRSQTARLRLVEVTGRARVAVTEGMTMARRALLVQPALDPQTVLEDQREASMDALPMSRATAVLAQAAPASAAPAAPSPLRTKFELLAKRRPVPNRTSQTAATAAVEAVRPPAPENAITWLASVSEAERQMARASDNNAGHVAALIDSPLASRAVTLGGTAAGAGMAFGLSAPETLWKAVAAADSHRKLAVARNPFSFAGPFAAQSEQSSGTTPTPALRNSDPQPAAPATATQGVTIPALPAVTLKALGYAESADGTAQAVLTDGSTLYVVNEGEEFAEHFRVIAIRPEDLEVEDEYTNQTFRLPLGD